MSTAEITAGLADLILLVEKGQAGNADIAGALRQQTAALQALADKHVEPPVVHATPTVNLHPAPPPAVTVEAPPIHTVVHVHEHEAKSKKVRLKVNRNSSGFIESLDIETLTE